MDTDESVMARPLLWVTHVCRHRIEWVKTGRLQDKSFVTRMYPGEVTCTSHQNVCVSFALLRRTPPPLPKNATVLEIERAREALKAEWDRCLDRREERAARREHEDHLRIKEVVFVFVSNGDLYVFPSRRMRWADHFATCLIRHPNGKMGPANDVMIRSKKSPRYGGTRTELNFETAAKLRSDDVLMWRCAMDWGRDPQFEQFPCRTDGTNVLTNFNEFVLPWAQPDRRHHKLDPFWPGEETWNTPLLRNIRALQEIRHSRWEFWLGQLRGRYVAPTVLRTIRSNGNGVSVVLENGRQLRYAGNGKPGQCYDGPCEDEQIVAPLFRIFRRVEGKEEIFIVDSFEYGIALRVFATRRDAEMYAQGGPFRQLAESRRLLWLAHDEEGEWRQILEETLRSAHFWERHREVRSTIH